MKNEIYVPTGSMDKYLIIYKELYKKYRDKTVLEKEQNSGGEVLKSGKSISTDSHFEYYLIEKGWEAMKQMLDRPIIESSKYKIGNKIKFIKESWIPKGVYDELKQHNDVECIGIISGIRTSAMGDGELIYSIKELTPECWESNPYATERNVLELIS